MPAINIETQQLSKVKSRY